MNSVNTYKTRFEALLAELDRSNSKLCWLALAGTILMGLLLRLYTLYMGQGYHYFAINDEVTAYEVALAFMAGEDKAQYIGQPNFSGGHIPGPGWALFWTQAKIARLC